MTLFDSIDKFEISCKSVIPCSHKFQLYENLSYIYLQLLSMVYYIFIHEDSLEGISDCETVKVIVTAIVQVW